MDNKKLIAAVQNYTKIKNEIVSDASIVASENGAVIYARVADIDDNYGVGLIIAGGDRPVLYGLAHLIINLSKKTGRSTVNILEALLPIIAKWEACGEKRFNHEV